MVDEGRRGSVAGEIAFAAAIWIAVAMIHLWRLGDVPGVFFHDEADNTVTAIQILRGEGPLPWELDWKPHPALAVNQIAASISSFGPSVVAVRLPSVVTSLLSLIAFYVVARPVAGPIGASLGMLLLGTHPGTLHFARSGWENAQVSLWMLLAMAALRPATAAGRLLPAAAAGALAGLSLWVYFSGRAVVAALGLWVAGWVAVGRSMTWRRRVVVALAFGGGLIALAAPLLPAAWENRVLFERRSRTVLVTSNMPESATWNDVAVQVVDNLVRSAAWMGSGAWGHQPPYHEPGQPLLSAAVLVALLLGMALSVRWWRTTSLWWAAAVVPFVLTQGLTAGTPNLARGITVLPPIFLFVALALGAAVRVLGRVRFMSALLVLAILGLAASRPAAYFRWARSPELARALEPAVPVEQFDEWWRFVNERMDRQSGFVNLGMWREEMSGRSRPKPETQLPDDRALGVRTLYRGATTSTVHALSLGTVQHPGGVFGVEVDCQEGADGVYDYVEARPVGEDGRAPIRVEAEDLRFTEGDVPVPFHDPDDHWWLQDFEPFSDGRALVCRRDEDVPPVRTLFDVDEGEWEVVVGTFTGDPANGPFALSVRAIEPKIEE